jgi:hypothetical protein
MIAMPVEAGAEAAAGILREVLVGIADVEIVVGSPAVLKEGIRAEYLGRMVVVVAKVEETDTLLLGEEDRYCCILHIAVAVEVVVVTVVEDGLN